MKIKDYNCKCGHDQFFFHDNGSQVGIYCEYCGKWFKWASKDELNLTLNKIDRKKGEWVDTEVKGQTIDGVIATIHVYECSICGFGHAWNGWDFCPNCGAAMK